MNQTASTEAAQPEIEKNWRYYLGVTCLALALLMPLLSLVVLPLDLPVEIKATIIAALTAGGPEVALVAAAALLGKDTLKVFKGRIFAAIRRLLPSKPASKFRYYASLTIMLVVYLGWYVHGYLGSFLPTELTGISALIVGDVFFIVAFVAAGPEFWEKIQNIFWWKGRLQDAA